MTNPTKETLELVLEVARKVYPSKSWQIIEQNGIAEIVVPKFQYNADCESYEPHKDTEQGKAQLMDLIFRLLKKGYFIKFGNPIGKEEFFADLFLGPYSQYCRGETLEEAIITLAIEVLSEDK